MFSFKKSDADKHEMILMSLGRALQNMPDLTNNFYEKLFASSDKIKSYFKTTNWAEQNIRLKGALSTVVMFDVNDESAVNTLERLQKTHGKNGMKIDPDLYNIWETCMVSIIKEADKEFNKEIEKEWQRVIRKTTDYLSKGFY